MGSSQVVKDAKSSIPSIVSIESYGVSEAYVAITMFEIGGVGSVSRNV